MPLPNTFANETSPNMSELDANFLAVATMGIIACAATGTNTIALTPSPLNAQPTIGVYANNQRFSFVAANTSSGTVTVQVNSLAALPLYTVAGTQATTDTITSGTYYVIVYQSTLNSGAGGFQISSPTASSAVTPVAGGSATGLYVTNNAAVPNTSIDITARSAVAVTSSGLPIYLSAPSVTIDLTTTGANGMDTGARPASAFVYCYLISNGSTTAGLATATSPTTGGPTMPGGYTYALYVGALLLNGSSNLYRLILRGKDASFKITTATNTPQMGLIASGINASVWSLTAPTYVNVALSGVLVPLTASIARVVLNGSYNGLTPGGIAVAPNTSYGGVRSSNGPPLCIRSDIADGAIMGDIELESTNIAYVAQAAGSAAHIAGWRDYYVVA